MPEKSKITSFSQEKREQWGASFLIKEAHSLFNEAKKCAALRQRILIGLFISDVESGAECLVNGGTDGADLLCVANNMDAGLGADMAHCVGLFRA